jgi:hypothetical protein
MIERTDHAGDGLIGDVRVSLRGGYAGVAEQDLHDPNTRSTFEQMRGECMPKAADRDALAESGGGRRSLTTLLNGGQTEGTSGVEWTRKEPALRALLLPISAQHVQEDWREGDVARPSFPCRAAHE